jgi:hypothetical protein
MSQKVTEVTHTLARAIDDALTSSSLASEGVEDATLEQAQLASLLLAISRRAIRIGLSQEQIVEALRQTYDLVG